MSSAARSALPRRARFAEPGMALWLILIAALVFLVASPMLRLVLASFQEPDSGRLTLANYAQAYGRMPHLRAILNSLELGTGVALLAGAISRTDMPAKGFIRLMVFGAFVIPPYLGAIGWILLAGPNAGWLNKVWMAATGAGHGILNVYSMAGLIVVVAVASFPYVFVFTNSALDLVSSEMEDAASILGAGRMRITFGVTLPLVLPAMIGGLIVSFLEAIALFGAPALIALPARFHVVSTQLWQFFEYPVRVEEAAAYAMPLLAITVLMFALQRSLLGRRGYVAVSGKGGERRMIRLGGWRWAMLGYALAVCTLSVLLPMLVLLQAAFAKAWGRGFALDNLTLANFRYILFEQTQAQHAILNTFLYAGASAFAAIALALAIAYVVNRKLVRWSSALALLCMAPFVIPGVVRLAAIRTVLAPLLKKSLAGAWLLVFIPATRELSSAIFLVGPHTRVISVMLFDLSEEGNFEVLSALGAVLLLATIAIAALAFRVVGRDFMLRGS